MTTIIKQKLKLGLNTYNGPAPRSILKKGSDLTLVLQVDPSVKTSCTFTVAKIGDNLDDKVGAYIGEIGSYYLFSNCFVSL